MHRIAKTFLLALTTCALTAASAQAAVHDGTFAPSGEPRSMALGPDGAVWFALAAGGTNKEFGRIAPDGTITEYDMPGNQTVGGIVAGPDVAGGPANRVWVAYDGGVAKIDPANPAAPATFAVNTIGAAVDIAPDRDGNLWVVDGNDGLVKVSPAGTKIADVPVNGSGGRKIVAGPDGRMLWTDFSNQAVWATQTAAPYTTTAVAPNLGNGPQALATGAGLVAFGLPGNQIGRFVLGGAPAFTTDTGGDAGFGVAFGDDRAFWLTRFAKDGLGRLDQGGGYSTPVSFPAGSGPRNMTRGAGGTLWVALEGSDRIARVSGVDAPVIGGATPPPLERPAPDRVRPKLSKLRIDGRKRRIGVGVSEAGTLRVALEKCTATKRVRKGKAKGRRRCVRYKRARFFRKAVQRGRPRLGLGGKVKAGRYRVSVVAVDRAGNRSAPARVSWVVREQKKAPGKRR